MPLYDYECEDCKDRDELVVPLRDLEKVVLCPCGGVMNRKLSAPRIQVDFPAYVSPATGKLIEGRRAAREDLKRSGCRLLDPGEAKDADRRRAESDARLDAAVEQTAGELVAALPDSKRESLAAELSRGVTATVERL